MELPHHQHRWKMLKGVFMYLILYMICFCLLEQRDVPVHLITCKLDQMIPFCEWFIIPYYLWFLYIAVFLFWFAFGPSDLEEFRRYSLYLCTGMTIFLFVSWIWPNGLAIRPTAFPRDNMLTSLVKGLYKTDTPTNVFPSIHVFNSLATTMAVWESRYFRKKTAARWSSLILTVLIVLSTLFLKQHSVVDMTAGLLLGWLLWYVCYHSSQAYCYHGKSPLLRRHYRKKHYRNLHV
ncbi:MAG: phosphatase PAP2 family protein [Lachnospiraceae bacterium]|nr:phosphatase PAP2 family protein [Lachnospiraceae bacterium]